MRLSYALRFRLFHFPATASVPLLRSFPPSSEACPYVRLSSADSIDYPVRCMPAIQRGLLTIQCSRASLCYPFAIFLPRLIFSVMDPRTLLFRFSPSRSVPSSPSRRLCRPAKCCICTTCHRCRSHSRACLPRSASVCSESSPRLRASLLSPGYLPTHWSRSYSLILKICYSHGFFVSLTARSILNTLQR